MTMTATHLPSEECFASLAALRAEHRRLQKLYRDRPDDPSTVDGVKEFIRRGRSTGAILDDENDQAAAQTLLDLWAGVLYRDDHPVPDPTLAPFDSTMAPTLADASIPYVGLDTFVEDQHHLFYGREQTVAHMVSRLERQNLLAINGPSGSGKSSLVLAGVVPALRRGAVPGSGGWRYLGRMVPGSDPLLNLSRLLWPGDAAAAAEQARALLSNPAAIVESLARVSPEEPTVLVIDQLEELSTLCEDRQTRSAFELAIVNMARTQNPRRVTILTMRNDFLNAIAREPSLQALLETALEPIVPLTAAELREAIERPAEAIGLKFEPGVVERLVHDILGEPAALPLLQFTLLKLWERRDHNRVTLEEYRTLGGGREALTRTADAFIDGLILEDRRIAEGIFRRLVRPGVGIDYVARRTRLRSLYTIAAPEKVDPVLGKLVAQRLLRLTGTGDDREVEIAHEALIRNWQHLVKLLEQDRERLTTGRRLEAKAAEWVRLGRCDAGLLKGGALAEATDWLAAPPQGEAASDDLEGLVTASVLAQQAAERRERRSRTVLVALAGGALVFAITAAAAAYSAIESRDQATAAGRAAEEERRDAIEASRNAVAGRQAAEHEKKRAEEERQRAEDEKRRAELEKRHADEARAVAHGEQVRADRLAAEALQYAQTVELKAAELARANDRIEAQRREFQRRDLTRAAEEAIGRDPEAAVGLALQAALMFHVNHVEVPPSTMEALRRASQANRSVAVIDAAGVSGLAFGPDGRRIATVSEAEALRVWDSVTGELQHVLAGAFGRAVAFAPDNRRIAVAGATVQIFDFVSGASQRTLTGAPAIDRLSFSPDGRALAGVGRDGAHLWRFDGAGANAYHALAGHDGPVRAVAFSPTGTFVATAGADARIRIWDATSGALLKVLEGHLASINDLAFHPDGIRLISGSDDRTVRIWTPFPRSAPSRAAVPVPASRPAGESATVRVVAAEQPVRALGFDADRRLLAFDDGVTATGVAASDLTSLVRLNRSTTFTLPPVKAMTLTFSPDGALLVAMDQSSVRVWNVSRDRSRSLPDDGASISSTLASLAVVPSVECSSAEVCEDGRFFKVLASVTRGNRLARAGDIDGAVASYEQAGREDRRVPVPVRRHAEGLRSIAEAEREVQAATGLLARVRAAARAGDRAAAASLLQTAPPEARKQVDVEALAQAARDSLAEELRGVAALFAADGDFAQTLAYLTREFELDPSAKADVEGEAWRLTQELAMQQARVALQQYRIRDVLDLHARLARIPVKRSSVFERDTTYLNSLCWRGSLQPGKEGQELARAVRDVCEKAVELTEARDADIRDSRGVNRARLGDFRNAIPDFEAYAADEDAEEEDRERRRRWIAALRRNQDPFTPAELEELR